MMTDIVLIKWLSIVLILITAYTAGIYPFLKKFHVGKGSDFPIGQALASGIFLGAGLMHMLGDADQGFMSAQINYPFAFLLAGATFLVLLLLEHLGQEISEHRGKNNPVFAAIAFVMLSIHSLLAGAALGFGHSISVVIVLLIAILAHKWAASFALAVQINNTSMKVRLGLILFSIFTIMTPIGVIFGTLVTAYLGSSTLLEPVFNSLAAGTFLYLGTLHGLSRAFMIEKCCNLKHFSFVIIGFMLMAVVAIWT